MWLDVTVLHETCKTYAKKQFEWQRELREKEIESYNKALVLSPNEESTPAFVESVKRKHRKYKPLLHLAHVLQLEQGNYKDCQYLSPARCPTAGKWRRNSSPSSSGSRNIDEGLPRWVGLSTMGPLLPGSRKSSALA
jgi:hypothetical protein